jgi:cytochrome P450
MTRSIRRDGDVLPPLPLPRERETPFGPPAEYARLRAEAPVTKVACPTGVSAWLVTRYADVRAVLADHRRFTARPGQAAHLATHMDPHSPVAEGYFSRMDGPEHVRFRRHLAPEVSSMARIRQLEPLVQRIVDERLDALATATPPVEWYGQFARPVTTAVIAELLGVPYADRGLFERAAEALFDTGTTGEEMAAALRPLFEYLYALIMGRRAALGDDALSGMIRRGDAGDRPFTDTELVMMSAGLLIAGYDTTATMISYGYLTLLAHPTEFDRLRADPDLAADAAEELVRYLGVGAGLLREVAQDTEIAGQPIAAGDYVVVAPQSANRDAALYPDADRLDLGRRPGPHLGFGHGPHQCVGQQLARLELTTVLRTVARRIPSLRLAVPFDEIAFKDDHLVRGPQALPVAWDAVLPAGA